LNATLDEFLLSEILQRGPLPFDQFMEQALYHPTWGFYASSQTRTGRSGDFLTPVSPGPVLGELLARQADELHEALGRPPVFHLVEQGADAGWLARDLFLSVQRNYPRLAQAARLHLVEPHLALEQKQRETLLEAGLKKSAQWHTSWNEFPGSRNPCLFYSCELVDSFPVKILQFRGGSWREKGVGAKDYKFVWQEREVDPETWAQIQLWNPPAIEGYTMEIRPGVGPWVQGWAEKISHGMVLTMDYGFPATDLFSPDRSGGTLVSIRNHQRVQDPLLDPGQLDLTAHVNFTELEFLATERGFKNYGLTDFARGLTALAAPSLKENMNFTESWIRNFRHLTHPSFFGHSHQILVQGKSLPSTFLPSILMKV